VGPVHLTDFVRTWKHPRPEVVPVAVVTPATAAGGPLAREVERVLRRVEQNLNVLTCTMPMVEIEDIPPSMQPHVVGFP
jgi:hypothetical protein